MTAAPTIGAVFPADADPADLPAAATAAERLGYASLWVVEDCFLSGGLTLAATALAVTTRLEVGVGLLPAAVRNPAIAAMEIATLARLHPGRFTATFGHGVPEWMEQIGARPAKRLAALGETVTVVRALLAGERVNLDGAHVHQSDVALDHPPAVAPAVLVGSTGPKGLALAAERADGALLPEGCGPAFVAGAVRRARAAGGTLETVVYAWMRIDDEPERARAALRPTVAAWRDSGRYPGPVAAAGLGAGEPLDDAALDRLAIVGDGPACAAAVERFAAAGVRRLVVVPQGDDWREQLERFAGAVPLG
ncbi:MAG TPA: LLM class flavin-dependent oxidoreductase [Conexibacter sp.]|nr:LLM class flavin-dependent oxidoreductase [Conexibacter sp.]